MLDPAMPQSSSIHMAGPHEPATLGTAPPINANWGRLDALFEGLPPGIPLLPPEDAGNFEKYTHRPRHVYAPGDGWKNCARALEKYDSDLCKGYREEIDTLLVFAGLFSAVVTAFTIESYQWLQADTNDAVLVLLSQIAHSVSPNNTVVPSVPAAAGLPGSVSVRINVYWFLALALSLSAALVAILCKQWIREFERNIGLSPKRFVGIHQTKLEGLERWKVGGIISLLPLLLQVALALFALGVLELLWQLHSATAAVVCVPTAAAFVFYAATTVLPALSSHAQSSFDCPYKSPQAMLVFPVYDICTWMRSTVAAWLSYLAYLRSLLKHHATVQFRGHRDAPFPLFEGRVVRQLELRLPEWDLISLSCNRRLDHSNTLQPLSVYRSLRWIHRNLDSGDAAEWIWHCLWETALAPDAYVPGGAAALKRGFCFVDAGAAHVPPSGLRALALAYLMQPSSPWPFLVEAFIQNLSALDAAGAEYLAGRMYLLAGTHHLDAGAMVSILGAASAYARAHAQEPIGGFLVAVTKLASRSARSAPALVGYATMLYHAWLGAHHLPATDATEELVWFVCSWLLTDPDPERLRQQVGPHELAELVSVYAQTHDDPAAELAVGMAPDEEESMRVIVEALLDMARHGQHTAGDGDSALVQPPPLAHADPLHGPALSRARTLGRETEGEPSCGPSSRRSTLSHARSPEHPPSRARELDESVEPEGERHGVSDRESPALRADAIHARVQMRPSRSNADGVHCADGEGDREDRASEGAPHDSASHGSASLRAVIIHSPSNPGAQAPAGNLGAGTNLPVPGDPREAREPRRSLDGTQEDRGKDVRWS